MATAGIGTLQMCGEEGEQPIVEFKKARRTANVAELEVQFPISLESGELICLASSRTSRHVIPDSVVISSRMNDRDDGGTLRLMPPLPGATADGDAHGLDSEQIMVEFLREMDELDRQQSVVPTVEAKRPREDAEAVVMRPKLKKKARQQTPEPPKKPHQSWLRRKEELQALREQTQAMESHVANLQLQRAQYQFLSGSDIERSKWKDAAVNERQQRQEAQEKNAVLKVQLVLYTQISGSLQSVLTAAEAQRKEQLARDTTAARALRVAMGTRQRLQFVSVSIFDMLEGTLNERFHDLDAIFYEMHQPVTTAIVDDVQINRDGGEGAAAAVEFRRTCVLPFDEGATSNALWGIIELGGVPDEEGSRITKRCEDVVAADARFMVPIENGDTVTIDMHCVLKRFAVPEGLVVLLESTSEWSVNLPSSGTWSHSTRDSGWILVRQYPLDLNGRGQPRACQMRSSMRMMPRGEAETGSSHCEGVRSLAKLTVSDVVIPSFREFANLRHQLVENTLLDSARAD
ncbi:hypothetical protein BBJ28_00008599 [Nothophytophthora sp. Chile5]|nr:hypothetical protein BBJ28_00008599 [Nothophytophthora sp. Chile5]